MLSGTEDAAEAVAHGDGEGHGQDDGVVERHLEDHDDGGQAAPVAPATSPPCPREQTPLGSTAGREEGPQHDAVGAAERRAHEERRREDAAGAPEPRVIDVASSLSDKENEEEADARERPERMSMIVA